jgi:hypothetical protein
VTETWDFGTSLELVMHKVVDDIILQADAEGIVNPLLDFSVGGEAVRVGKASAELLKLRWGKGRSFAFGDIEVEQGREAAVVIGGKPTSNGVACNAEDVGKLGA